jgi:phosphatidylinositol glycan class T
MEVRDVITGSLLCPPTKSGSEALDVAMSWPADSVFEHPLGPADPPLVPLSVWRTLKGSSQDRGRLSVVIENVTPSELKVIYLETMPWLLQFYLHTLQITSEGLPRGTPSATF